MENPKASELRARVFLSCGQSKDSDEISIASQIRDRLLALGFDSYVAVQEQTLRGLKENIFEQLSKSEYFIFVDFKRELLDPRSGLHRGSLFCHQELAIASYLEVPVLAFQESGVKVDDGILRFIQANATPFSDRHLLPSMIADEVSRRKDTWDPRWRNELVLERDPAQYSPTELNGRRCRFFHVGVRNRHRSKTARNCYAYLEKVTRLDPDTEIPVKQVEFCWAGYSQPNAHVFPGRVRAFDGFFIFENSPTQLQFNVFATGTDFVPKIAGEGRYELDYSVVSENFPETRISLALNLGLSLDLTALVPKAAG